VLENNCLFLQTTQIHKSYDKTHGFPTAAADGTYAYHLALTRIKYK